MRPGRCLFPGDVDEMLCMTTKSAPEFPGALGLRPVLRYGYVVLNDERRPGAGGGVIAAEELHVIRAVVIVVILHKVQAELGGAGLVDIGVAEAANDRTVPVVDRRGSKVPTAATSGAA